MNKKIKENGIYPVLVDLFLQKEQGARLIADGFLLLGIGILMTLASLAILGVKLGALAGAAAIAANPYVMPILILLLALPGLLQTLKHIASTSRGMGVEALLNLDDRQRLRNNPYLIELEKIKGEERFERAAQMMETISEKIGVEGAVSLFDLFHLLLENRDQTTMDRKIEEVRKRMADWNRMVCMRAVQLSLYGLTFPIGLASAFLASSISRVVNGVSRFFLAVPSSMGTYMDACEPFKRNGSITVPKVEFRHS